MSSAFQHRHCFLLQGDRRQILSDFQHLSQNLRRPLICAHDVSDYQAWGEHEQANTELELCTFKQAKQQLGVSHEAVLIDLSDGISVEVIAILAGTVRGGGVFAIGLPAQGWQQMADQELARYLPWPLVPEQVNSHFKDFFWQRLCAEESPFVVFKDPQHTVIAPLSPLDQKRQLSPQQQHAQQRFMTNRQGNHVLLAPRGRGKSTLLGDCLGQLVRQGKKVALTAPNQQAIVTLKQHYESLTTEFDLPFYAADALLNSPQQWDYLLVDEAAMIPVPMLKALANKAQCTLFSTTDYGYEGAGKGFGLRFCEYLAGLPTPLTRLTLETPIRWGENDPLETWLNQQLLLSPAEPTSSSAAEAPMADANPQHLQTIRNQQWLAQEALLIHSFQLLLNAHYQTSPENLRWMLDDPSVQGFTLTETNAESETLLSVAIVTAEGPLPTELSQAVMEGRRRPRGHLLPQSLLAHEGHDSAANYAYWRISRIATQTSQQQKGYASRLLNYVEKQAQQQGIDFLACSFAATLDTVKFWRKNGFHGVRLGTTKDQASGCYSLMMIKPLNATARSQAQLWQQQYLANLMINLPMDYEELDPALAELLGLDTLSTTQSAELSRFTAKDQQDLLLFAQHHRPYLTIRAQLSRWYRAALVAEQFSLSSADQALLSAVTGQAAHRVDFKRLGFSAKKLAEKRLKAIILQHLG